MPRKSFGIGFVQDNPEQTGNLEGLTGLSTPQVQPPWTHPSLFPGWDMKKLNGILNPKCMDYSGETLGVNQVERFYRLFTAGGTHRTRLINLYGPTEATVDVSYFNCPDHISLEKVPLGKPIDNLRLAVLDQALNLQPIGVVGEICISGIGLARGYLNRPELTAEKFDHDLWDSQDYHDERFLRGGPGGAVFSKSVPPGRRRQKLYKTGDMARWLPDGNAEFMGRIDNQVKIRGFRIEVGEIENRLLKHQDIKEVVVMTHSLTPKKNDEEEYLCAYIIAEREFDVSELRDFLLAELPEYMVPSYFVPLEKMPLAPNGKIDRKALPAPAESPLSLATAYVEPGSNLEKIMVSIWQEELQLEKIGINDNFFDLWGNSLAAIRLINRLNRELNRDNHIPVISIFKYRTIRSFCHYLDCGEEGAAVVAVSSRSRGKKDIQKLFDQRSRTSPQGSMKIRRNQ